MSGAEEEFSQAQKELNQAAAEFEKEAARGFQQNGQTSWSQASEATPENQPAPRRESNPANGALQGSPETGYAGTWTDPANGDVVTTVIAPKPPVQNSQNYPIIVEPQINPGGYGGYSAYGMNPYTGGWSNWQTSYDNPGYPPQSPPYNQPPPPGWHAPYPGQPYPGFNPYPYPFPQPYPGYEHGSWGPSPALPPGAPGSMPPPFNPNYRPLRPGHNQGSIWQPGMTPPASGANPPMGSMPPNGRPPQGGAAPGMGMPPSGAQPLPLRPSGQSWNNSAQGGRPGGIFGPRTRGGN